MACRRVTDLLQRTTWSQYVWLRMNVHPAIITSIRPSLQCPPTRCIAQQSLQQSPLPAEKKTWLQEKMSDVRLKFGMLENNKSYYRRKAVSLYECIDDVRYTDFFKAFKMEDTLYSWFLIMELHVWMLQVRGSAEGKEGAFLNKSMLEYMWVDVKKRSTRLQDGISSQVSRSLMELHEEFTAAIICYDEGLQSSDMVLASVIWRRFLLEQCDDPQDVELLVKYIRRQVQHLDTISKDQFIRQGSVTWLPLHDK